MDFVIGFGGNRLNPSQVMPAVRTALVAIFSEGEDPWEAIIKYCTIDARVLGHTSIILVDRTEAGELRGRQLMYSHQFARPWGYIPACGHSGCTARPGDVYGDDMRTKASKRDKHKKISLHCKVCKHWCIVDRPDWITHAHKQRPFYFQSPWPLTTTQIRHAMGLDGRWILNRAALPSAEVACNEGADGVMQEIESVDAELADEMEVSFGHGEEEDGNDVAEHTTLRVMSPVSPNRSRPTKRTKVDADYQT